MHDFNYYLKKIYSILKNITVPVSAESILDHLCRDFCKEHRSCSQFFDNEPWQSHYLLAVQLSRAICNSDFFLGTLNQQLIKCKIEAESEFFHLLKAYFYFYPELYRSLDKSVREKMAISFDYFPVNEAAIVDMVKYVDDENAQVAVKAINLLAQLRNRLDNRAIKKLTSKLLTKIFSTDLNITIAAINALSQLPPFEIDYTKNELIINLLEAVHNPRCKDASIILLKNILTNAPTQLIKRIYLDIVNAYSNLQRATAAADLFIAISSDATSEIINWLMENLLNKMDVNQNETDKNLIYLRVLNQICIRASERNKKKLITYLIAGMTPHSLRKFLKPCFEILCKINYAFSNDNKQAIFSYATYHLNGFSRGSNKSLLQLLPLYTPHQKNIFLEMFFHRLFVGKDELLDEYIEPLGTLISDHNELFMTVAKEYLGINFSRLIHYENSNEILVKVSKYVDDSYKIALNENFWRMLFQIDAGSAHRSTSYDFRYIVDFFPQAIIDANLLRIVPNLLTKRESSGLLDTLFIELFLGVSEELGLEILKSITSQSDSSNLDSSFMILAKESPFTSIKEYIISYYYKKALNSKSNAYLIINLYKKMTNFNQVFINTLKSEFAESAPYLALLTLEEFNKKVFAIQYDNSLDKINNIVNMVLINSQLSCFEARHYASNLLGIFADALSDKNIEYIINIFLTKHFHLDRGINYTSRKIIQCLSVEIFKRDSLKTVPISLLNSLLASLTTGSYEILFVSKLTLIELLPAILSCRKAAIYVNHCLEQLSQIIKNTEEDKIKNIIHEIIIVILKNVSHHERIKIEVYLFHLLETIPDTLMKMNYCQAMLTTNKHSGFKIRFNIINQLMKYEWSSAAILSTPDVWRDIFLKAPTAEIHYFLYGVLTDIIDKNRSDNLHYLTGITLFTRLQKDVNFHAELAEKFNDNKDIADLVLSYSIPQY